MVRPEWTRCMAKNAEVKPVRQINSLKKIKIFEMMHDSCCNEKEHWLVGGVCFWQTQVRRICRSPSNVAGEEI